MIIGCYWCSKLPKGVDVVWKLDPDNQERVSSKLKSLWSTLKQLQSKRSARSMQLDRVRDQVCPDDFVMLMLQRKTRAQAAQFNDNPTWKDDDVFVVSSKLHKVLLPFPPKLRRRGKRHRLLLLIL